MWEPPVAEERKLGLKQVLECTKQVVQWDLLGIQLGIDPTVIRMIQHQHSHSVEQCKMEMFTRWLVSEENPTWEKLVEALENRGDSTVAREIRDKIGLQDSSDERNRACPILTLVKIQDHFAELQTSAREAIVNDFVNAKAVTDSLLHLPASYTEAIGANALFPEVLLPHPPSGVHINNLVKTFSSFLTYNLVEYCIQKVVHGREQLVRQLQDYKRLLESFVSTTTLASSSQESSQATESLSPLPGTEVVQIELGEMWTYHTLKQLTELADSLIDGKFPPHGLVFQFLSLGKSGMVKTTWLASTNIVTTLKGTFEEKKSSLKASEILRIAIGEKSILDGWPKPTPRKGYSQSVRVRGAASRADNVSTSRAGVLQKKLAESCIQEKAAASPTPKPRSNLPKKGGEREWNRSFSVDMGKPQHHLSASFYCQTCSKYLTVMSIATGEHENHQLTYLPVEENTSDVLQRLTQSLEENNNTEDEARTLGMGVQQDLRIIEQTYLEASLNIKCFFASVRGKVELRNQELVREAMALKQKLMKTTSQMRHRLSAMRESCKKLKEQQDVVTGVLQVHNRNGGLQVTESRRLVWQLKQDLQRCQAQLKEVHSITNSVHFDGNAGMLKRQFEAIGCYSTVCSSKGILSPTPKGAPQANPFGMQTKPSQVQNDSTVAKTTTTNAPPLPPRPGLFGSSISQNPEQSFSFRPRHPTPQKQQTPTLLRIARSSPEENYTSVLDAIPEVQEPAPEAGTARGNLHNQQGLLKHSPAMKRKSGASDKKNDSERNQGDSRKDSLDSQSSECIFISPDARKGALVHQESDDQEVFVYFPGGAKVGDLDDQKSKGSAGGDQHADLCPSLVMKHGSLDGQNNESTTFDQEKNKKQGLSAQNNKSDPGEMEENDDVCLSPAIQGSLHGQALRHTRSNSPYPDMKNGLDRQTSISSDDDAYENPVPIEKDDLKDQRSPSRASDDGYDLVDIKKDDLKDQRSPSGASDDGYDLVDINKDDLKDQRSPSRASDDLYDHPLDVQEDHQKVQRNPSKASDDLYDEPNLDHPISENRANDDLYDMPDVKRDDLSRLKSEGESSEDQYAQIEDTANSGLDSQRNKSATSKDISSQPDTEKNDFSDQRSEGKASDDTYDHPEDGDLNRRQSESTENSSEYISMGKIAQPYLVVGRDQLKQATSKQFSPVSACCIGNGRIAFTNGGDSIIRTFSQNGSGMCTNLITSCQFLLPHTLATFSIDGKPTFGVIEKGSNSKCQIQVFQPNGTRVQVNTLPRIENPGGMTMDSMQQVYVSEERGLVYKFTLSGKFLQEFKVPGAKKLGSLIVMENGSIVVTDEVRNCLWIVDKNGEKIHKIGTHFLIGPCSVSLSSENCIIVVNKEYHAVSFVDIETEDVRATFGVIGSDHGQFKSPEGACLSSDGSLVVADTGNHRLQLFAATDLYT